MGRKQSIKTIKSINYNNCDYNAEDDIANCFTQHFENTFSDYSDPNFDVTFKEQIDLFINNFDFKSNTSETIHFDIIKVKKVIASLRTDKAYGEDKVHNHLLKHLPDNAIYLMVLLFEKSVNSGIVPKAWKHAIISVIPKPNKDPTKTRSYRPISLLSCLGKVLERLINEDFNKYLESKNILIKEQSGFRKNHLTTDNLTRLCLDIKDLNAQRKHKVLLAIFLDIEKCFDRIWINRLKYKILNSGYNNKISNWLCNFLTNRTLGVKINNFISCSCPITAGVPQGAILSPTLYNLYSSDLPRNEILLKNTKISAYADDLSLYNLAPKHTHYLARIKLQESVDILSKWANKWRIKLNPIKCTTIQFSKPVSDEHYYMPIQINGEYIPKSNFAKFLGLYINENCNWANHVNNLTAKSTSIINGLKLAKAKGVRADIILAMYTTFIKSIFSYAAPAWSQLFTKSQQLSLERVQNKAIKIAFRFPPWTKTSTILEISKLKPLKVFFKELTTNYIKKKESSEHMQGYIHRLQDMLNKNMNPVYPTPIT